jgi:PAS domain S-box-containing protein
MANKFKISEYSQPALKTAVYFFVFGFFWILLSDHIVHQLAASQEIENQLQTYKGWFFILITTILIYLVVKDQIRVIIKLKNKLSESEKKYKKIVDITNDVVWYTNPDGVILFINNACEKVYGIPASEMIGKKFSDYIPEDRFQQRQKFLSTQIKKGINPVVMETEILHRKGHTVVIKNKIEVVFDDNGQIIRFEGNSTDITKQKHFEENLLKSKEKLEMAMSGGEIVMWEFWTDTKKLTINQHNNDIVGYQLDNPKINYQTLIKLAHPDDRENVENAFSRNYTEKENYQEYEFRLQHQNGEYRWFTSKGRIVERINQKPLRLMGTLMDTTTKKELELNLTNLVNIYSSFVKYSSEGIYLFEMNQPMPIDLPVDEQIKRLYHNGYIRTCNDAFARMYGLKSTEEIIGADQKTLHGSDDIPENLQLLKNFITNGYRIVDEITFETDKNGNRLYISNSVTGIIENGFLLRNWGIQRNITAQIIARQKLQESEKRYRLLFETNPVPLIIFDSEKFNLIDANSATIDLLGYSKAEISTLTLDKLRPELSGLSNDEITHHIEKEISKNIETELVSKNGNKIPCSTKFDTIKIQNVNAILGAINDLTAIKRAEKLVIQSLIEGADTERTRVAKEIHDSLGQSLTAANLNLNAIRHQVVKAGKNAAEKLDLGLNFLKIAIEESRNIAHNLMPKAIEDFGIVLSLKSLFNQIEKSTGLKIDFYENLKNHMRFDLNIELNLYRITQEALNNTIKHSGATTVFVQLMLHPGEIIYTFEDNGKGFDKTEIMKANKGIGLKSIANRAKAMSGHFDIDTATRGTTLTIIIPFDL